MFTDHPALTAERDGAVVAATVLILRDSESGPEVLLLQRNPEARNMGGAWMFPGGKVDAEDEGDTEVARAAAAAVREIEEEASIAVDPASLVGFSHWLTPVVEKRRFATWFYLAPMPAGTTVTVDGSEMVQARWVRPEIALQEHRAGELRLPPPTVVSLVDLSRHATVGEALEAARQREAPFFFPKILPGEGKQMVMLYPGDAGYDAADVDAKGVRHRSTWRDGVITYENSNSGMAL